MATSSFDPAPTVFIVDDAPSARRGLAHLLRAEGFPVEAFESAEAFLERLPFGGVGCIILDVAMPGIQGTELQEMLKRIGCNLPIVFVTGHGDIPMGIKAMKRGASDFLTKPVEAEDLLEAVRQAVARHRETCATRAAADQARERLASLTPRERQVIYLVAAGKLNKQIGYDLRISEATVKVHRGRGMDKLGVASVAELIRLLEIAT